MREISEIQAYVPAIYLSEILPFVLLTLGAVLCLVIDAFTDKAQRRQILPIVTGGTLVAALISIFMNLFPKEPFAEGAFFTQEAGQLACVVILFSALATTILAPKFIEKRNIATGEFYALILFSTLGMTLLSVSNELLTAFISLEIMSLSLYVLTGIDRRSTKANEASFKYIILGAFASAFLVFGIAFLYGATGTTRISDMTTMFVDGVNAAQDPINPIWVYIGFGLMFVGACFKLSLAPFHMWAPDVYEGSNTPTTIFIATGSKAAALIFVLNLVQALSYWGPFATSASFIIGLVAVASMAWGNIAALVQTNFKRMMAYSSVAQTGYMTVGLLVLAVLPAQLSGVQLETAQIAVRQAIVLYMAGYTLMTVLAFGVAYNIEGEGHMGAYRGLAYRNPLPAAAMGVAMFSLVGIGFTPPTIGFMGKFFLFKEAVQHGLVSMAVIAVLASVISAFYYLSLVVTMFMRDQTTEEGVTLAGGSAAEAQSGTSIMLTRMFLVAAVLLIFALGFYPGLFLGLGFQFAGIY